MQWHRPLSEMLTDVQAATEVTAGAGEKVRIRSVEMTLPLEVWLDDEAGEMRLLGDLPVWRWRAEHWPGTSCIFPEPASGDTAPRSGGS